MNPFSGRRFRSALKYFLIGRAAQGVLALAFALLAVRVMQTNEYGAYLVIIGLIDLARPLSSFGLLPTVQQFLPEMALHASPKQLRAFVRWSKVIRWLLLGALVALIYLFWSPLISWMGMRDVVTFDPLLVCLLISAVLAGEFTQAMQEALLEQRYAQALRLGYTLARLTGLAILALIGNATLTAVLWLDCVAALVCLVAAEAVLSNRLAALTPDGNKRFSRKEIVQFGLHLSGYQALYSLATPGALRVVVAKLLGLEAAGFFGFIQTILSQINRLLPSALLVNLVRPMLIAARTKGSHSVISEVCGLLLKSNMLLLWPLIPIVLIGGDGLVSSLSGGKIEASLLAMTWMMLTLLPMSQMNVISTLLQANSQSKVLLWAGFLALLAPPFVALGSLYSLEGATFGLFLAAFVRNLVMLGIVQKSSSRIDLDLKGSLRFLISIGVAFAVAELIVPLGNWTALVSFALVLILLMPFSKPLSKSDTSIIRRTLKRNFAQLDAISHK